MSSLAATFAQKSIAWRGKISRARLCCRRHGTQPGEFQRQPPEDREVGVEPDALDATHAEHRQSVVVLQAAELALDGGATAVEAAPLVALCFAKPSYYGSRDRTAFQVSARPIASVNSACQPSSRAAREGSMTLCRRSPGRASAKRGSWSTPAVSAHSRCSSATLVATPLPTLKTPLAGDAAAASSARTTSPT